MSSSGAVFLCQNGQNPAYSFVLTALCFLEKMPENYMVNADPAKMNAWSDWNSAEPNLPWPLIFTGMLFNNIYWWCCNQSFVQRSLAAKSLKEGQKGAIFCGFLKCAGPLYLIIPGIIAYHFLPSRRPLRAQAILPSTLPIRL